jgi:hypothetical protein
VTETLVDLAQEFVRLSGALEDVRRRMKAALANGADPTPNPTRRRGSALGGKRDETMAKAAEAEEAIIALLREGPKRRSEIITVMDAAPSTTQMRLKRLLEKGAIGRNDDGLWFAL